MRLLYVKNGIENYGSDCNRCHGYLSKYGLNSVEIDWMYFLQGNVCANPGCNNEAGNLDHCHETGKLRDMLCPTCNISLGNLGEDPQRIAGLIQYIAMHSEES